jgi:hypothetical protein
MGNFRVNELDLSTVHPRNLSADQNLLFGESACTVIKVLQGHDTMFSVVAFAVTEKFKYTPRLSSASQA